MEDKIDVSVSIDRVQLEVDIPYDVFDAYDSSLAYVDFLFSELGFR